MYDSNLKRIIEKFELGRDYTKQEIFNGLRELKLVGTGIIGRVSAEWNFRKLHNDGGYCYGQFVSTSGKPGYYHFEGWSDDF